MIGVSDATSSCLTPSRLTFCGPYCSALGHVYVGRCCSGPGRAQHVRTNAIITNACPTTCIYCGLDNCRRAAGTKDAVRAFQDVGNDSNVTDIIDKAVRGTNVGFRSGGMSS